jgi:hypothetical protein
MIFNRTYNLHSTKKNSDIKSSLLGKKFPVHKIEFEIVDVNGITRVVPHAEEIEGERILTLPVTRISITDANNGSKVKLSSHPRRTDIGGPMLLMIACILFFIVGLALYYKGTEDVHGAAKIMLLISSITAILMWIKMELGYFDYVRKIKNYIKANI